ncbi:MAG TPA: type IV pilus assembly protein PilM, partial [Verrucomicrobiae bacterium]|nr:type IV pilus assembly protein PilM [Verrucomicrobiae bacterium]
MLNSKSFVAVDFGAGSLKLAEFEVTEAGGLSLKQFVIKPLGLEGSQETKREAVILKALQEVLAEKGIKAKDVNVCAPGFHVFSKFVKLPPVDAGKVTQIIQYEAQQNVPFPLAEVVWDYQILGSTSGGELEVLLVAIKSDIVEGLFRVTESAGLRLQLCDVSPAALCNAFRYNYGDLEDCTMLLDIGAKTSNLLFFEKGKVFSRSINLGANSITQDFANESKLKFDVADKIKIDEGFVSLGGAYEEPENPHQAAISKIARQFMTRLHIQVNQTMQFYRGQQGGSAPQRLFLCGGASIMPYTAQFFAEKLNVPVEYFNPFRSVQIDPAVNLEELARVAHSLGEVVGLGLRNLAHCPVELNLMPDSTLRWQSFNQKKPYFIATVFSLVIMSFAVGYLFERLAEVKKDQQVKLEETIKPLLTKEVAFKKEYGQLKKTQQDLEQTTMWMEDRYYWAEILKELRLVLIRAEDVAKKKLGTDTGIWIEKMESMTPATSAEADASAPPQVRPMYERGPMTPEQIAFAKRYGLPEGGRYAPQAPPPPPAEVAPAPPPPVAPPEGGAPGAVPGTTLPAAPGATNEIAKVTL